MRDGHKEMMARIRRNAELAFGPEGARQWLTRTWRVFDHKTPIEMADKDAGRVLEYVQYFIADERAARPPQRNLH